MGAAGVVLLASSASWPGGISRCACRTDDAQIDGHVNAVSARVGRHRRRGARRRQPVRREGHAARADRAPATTRSPWRGRRPTWPRTRRRRAPRTRRADDHHDVHLAGDRGRGSDLEGAEARLVVGARAPARGRGQGDARRRRTWSGCKPLLAKDEVSRQEYDAAVLGADAAHAARESADGRGARGREAESRRRRRASTQARTGPEQVTIAEGARRLGRRPRRRWRGPTSPRRGSTSSTPRSRPPSAASSAAARSRSGQVVQAGQPLLAVVPLEDVWVVANYKENQLRRIRPGQPAIVAVDAYGGREYRGKVESIAAGDRRALQHPAARERERQLREGRAARAGQDRARPRPGSRPPAAARDVGRAHDPDAMSHGRPPAGRGRPRGRQPVDRGRSR